uniref:SCAN box domain-containing protein n=1 Tax=Pelusios castaneus TaxID=367368 RepID=A0A8C8S9Y1_9SAUR
RGSEDYGTLDIWTRALIYGEVKKAVLDQTGINPETYRQRLRHMRFPTRARPRVVAQRIKEDCWRWLEPGQKTGGQVAEEVTLEQFVQGLSPGGKEWVQRHRPKMLAEAVSLTEDYMAAERPEVSSRRTDTPYKGDVGTRRERPNFTPREPPPSLVPPATSPCAERLRVPRKTAPGSNRSPPMGVPPSPKEARGKDFVQEQREDLTLRNAWDQASSPEAEGNEEGPTPQGPRFE